MISDKEPKNFINKHDVVSCFCEHDGKILLLLRADHKSEGNKWGPPAGKVDDDEDIHAAIKREVLEETGLDVPVENFTHLKKLYVRYPDYDFVYHVFRTKFGQKPKVSTNPKEHKDYIWTLPDCSKEIELVLGQDLVHKMFYKSSS